MKADYYETLGIERGAATDTIKKAFRRLAMQYHPDRNPGDEEAERRFKELNEAYDVLKDEQKRAAYDRYGHAAFENGHGARGAGDFAGGFADIFEEMFGDIMGGGRRGRETGRRGNDLSYKITITLEEAFAGKETVIRVPSSVACGECGGSGAEKGTQPVSCPTCRGAGRVRATQGFFTVERTCPRCHGMGKVIEHACNKCRGNGRIAKERELSVTIPAGIEDGTRIRLAGEGEAGLQGGGNGDLYLFLSVAAHPFFSRHDADLYCHAPITYGDAALGGQIMLTGIDGEKLTLTVPPGAQAGQRLRLRGKGMSILKRSGRGDLYVELGIETPVHLSSKQKELLRSFVASLDEKNIPQSHHFRSS